MDNEKLSGLSMDIDAAEQDKLRSLFPQCFTDGRLDVSKLLAVCGQFETADENDREKYEFRWNGKQACLQLAGKRSAGTLRPCPRESVNWDETQNVYIEGDNLEVLKLLQTAYYRKVKMIYIDPPYNTGNDFVYADDFADPLARYREVTQQTTKSNPETMGRFHTNWLNMMYPRLRLAANLLRDDGVIFISIDDGEVHNLRKICDEVFGEENFVAQISVVSNPRGRDYGGVAKMHDFILVYRKTSSLEINLINDPEYSFKQFDEMGGFELRELRNRNIKFNKDNRPNLYYPFYINPHHVDANGLYEISIEQRNEWIELYPLESQGIKTVWRWGKPKSLENLNVNIKAKSMVNGSYQIVEKYRESRIMARSVWWDKESNTEKGTLLVKELFDNKKVFDYPKTIEMLMRMLQMGTDNENEDIILDFFSGSATTAHAVMQLNVEDGGNRRFILVQLPEVCDENSEAFKAGYKNICEIGKERIRRAGAKIAAGQDGQIKLEEKAPLDIGFQVFKLDTSNLKLWDDTPITGENALEELKARIEGMLDIIKPDRAEMDVVYEVMLKLGQELNTPVTKIDINGKTGYSVGAEEKFMVCLAAGVTTEDAEAMTAYSPGQIIFANACFENTEQKSNVRLTLKDRGIGIRTL